MIFDSLHIIAVELCIVFNWIPEEFDSVEITTVIL